MKRMNNQKKSTQRWSVRLSALLFATVALLTIPGCEKDVTPISSAPDKIGPITLGATRIGAGQTFNASCDIPSGGAEILEVTYDWVLNQGIPFVTTPKEGKSAVQITAPTSIGEHKIYFSASYRFRTPDSDGNFAKKITATTTFNVVPCDVRTSFWNDDVTKTLAQVPSLKKSTEEWYEYDAYDANLPDLLSLQNIDPPKIPTRYWFDSESKLLQKVSEHDERIFDTPRAYFSNYEIVRTRIVKSVYKYGEPYSETITRKGANNEPPVIEPLNYASLTPEQKDQLGADLSDGIISLEAKFKNPSAGSGKTEVSLRAFSVHPEVKGKINYLRTYTPVK